MDLIYYNGEHSANIGNKDTWEDWHLIPSSKIVISPPGVKTKQVDIPGADGTIDLTSILTGYPTYGNRTGNMEFILAPGFASWEDTKATIESFLHGKNFDMILRDDPSYYYTGMFMVNGYKSDARLNGITISYDLYPFKRELIMSDDDWLWDPFNFETGVIRGYDTLTVDGTLTLEIADCTEPVMPIVIASAAMTMEHTYTRFGNEITDQYSIPSGTSTPGAVIAPGENTFEFTGHGTITFRYRGGRL